MNIPHIALSFLLGVAMLAAGLIAQNWAAEATCAKQFNVYSCDRAVVMVPRGDR